MAREDRWASGDEYEPYVGRWSRLVAREFLTWLAIPPDKDWLDVGCGTGALSQTILEVARPRNVRGIDPSPDYADYAREHTPSPLVTFGVGDARSIPAGDASFDAVASGLVLNFVPTPADAVNEMVRVAKPNGVVAAYVWDYADKMELIRYFWNAAVALDPAASELDEGPRFPICNAPSLEELFTAAGSRSVETRAIDVPTHFSDFDDYWAPFLGGQGPAPGYAMSLDEDRRNLLRDRIREELPAAADGSIDLIARAWAVKGMIAS